MAKKKVSKKRKRIRSKVSPQRIKLAKTVVDKLIAERSSASQLKAMGYSPQWLRHFGYSATKLKKLGYTTSDLITLGFRKLKKK